MKKQRCQPLLFCASLILVFSIMGSLYAQTITWTGTSGTDWNTTTNWNPAQIPLTTNDVKIPNVTNDPTISAGDAVAQSVEILAGGVLTLSSNGVLSVDGTANYLILNKGTIHNNGTVNTGQTANGGVYGIFNGISGSPGTFNNNATGVINADRSSQQSVVNGYSAGTFHNYGTINIGQNAAPGTIGFLTQGLNFTNHTTGNINIDRSTGLGWRHSNGAFTNNGTVTIGANNGVGTYCFDLWNTGTFTNNSTGVMNLDRSTSAAIFLESGSFENSGAIKCGAIASIGTHLITGTGPADEFKHYSTGTIEGTGIIISGHIALNGGKLSPGNSPGKITFGAAENFSNSTLDIEVVGAGGVGGTDFDQVVLTTGTATVGASTLLNLVFSYAATAGATFDILTATAISGTITAGNITFINTGAGNVAGVTVSYPTGKVRVTVNSVLPVELTHFSAKKVAEQIVLDWQTASEMNNRGFEIERSSDGIGWQNIGFENGKGTTTDRSDYAFLDQKPLAGQSFYRLRQMDFDGKSELSSVVSIHRKSQKGPTIAPNPATANGFFVVLFDEKSEAQTIVARLFDPSGRLVKSQILSDEKGSKISTDGLAPGLFWLEIEADGERFFEKILVR